MGVPYHTMLVPDGLNAFAASDRVFLGTVDVTYASGGAGVAVTTAVTWKEPVPGTYAVLVDLPEDGVAFCTTRTSLGFTLSVSPRLAANSLAGGVAQCVIVG